MIVVIPLQMVEQSSGIRQLGLSTTALPDVVSSNKPWLDQRSKARARMVRIRSPVMPPPSWGQAVAPPPTPHYTPHTSPRSGDHPYGVVETDPASSTTVYANRNELFVGVGVGVGANEGVDRRHLRHSLQRRLQRRHHRRLRSSGSSSSRCSSSRCPNLCHQNCRSDSNLQSQPEVIVYAYTFDGDVIDRRPLINPMTDLANNHRQENVNYPRDNLHRAFQPGSQPNLIVESEIDDEGFYRRRRAPGHRPPFTSSYVYDPDLQTVEPHRPPHNSLSSSPLGGGTTTASGSISPALSPILNIGDEVTRLTTSPATPPHTEVAKIPSILSFFKYSLKQRLTMLMS